MCLTVDIAPLPFSSLCWHIQKAEGHEQSRSKKPKWLRATDKFVKIILLMNTRLFWKKDIARKYIFLPHFSDKKGNQKTPGWKKAKTFNFLETPKGPGSRNHSSAFHSRNAFSILDYLARRSYFHLKRIWYIFLNPARILWKDTYMFFFF